MKTAWTPCHVAIVLMLLVVVPALPVSAAQKEETRETRLSIEGTRFAINGQPTFLLGISYYAGLGAPEQHLKRDLDQMQRFGFNWFRLWATWAGFSNDVSAVDATGLAREPHFSKLKRLIQQCNQRGMIVDISLSRGNGISGSPRLGELSTHRRAVETLVGGLQNFPNWYLDLSNERNIKDKRFTSIQDLQALREVARKVDPARLVTASHAGDISREELRDYLKIAKLDFLSPHRPRHAGSAGQTAAKTKEYLKSMEDIGRVVPVHYQEPFRRGFGGWNPVADDFSLDFKQAKTSGAAGWCFHNGDERARPNGEPRRSFDLREKSLFENLDREELNFLKTLITGAN